jgi:hypothetical protein
MSLTSDNIQTLIKNKSGTEFFKQGTKVPLTDDNFSDIFPMLDKEQDRNGWYKNYCDGFRFSVDETYGLTSFTIKDTIKF